MDGLGLAAVITTGALGFAGLATSIWSTKEASRVARRGRVDEKRIDACVEILRLVEHKTLWFESRVTAAEIAGDPFENAPRLPREPDVGERAIIETLLAAYGSPLLKDACIGWTGAAIEMDKGLEVAAWTWEQAYHGPETPTSPNDLVELRLRLDALLHEKRVRRGCCSPGGGQDPERCYKSGKVSLPQSVSRLELLGHAPVTWLVFG